MDDAAQRVLLGLAAVLGLVFVNAFFVAAEYAIVTVRKTRIDQLIAEGNRLARFVRRAVSAPESYIATTQLAITMTGLALGWIGEPAIAEAIAPLLGFLPLAPDSTSLYTVATGIAFVFMTALVIIFGELAPKTIALQYPERVSLLVALPTELFRRAFWPFIALLNNTGRVVVRMAGFRPPSGHSLVHSEEELKMLVTASQEAGVLEENEEQMLHRVFDFADFTAGQVMVPRTEMTALPVDATLPEVLERIAGGGHTWVPVYNEHLDDIVGVLHVADLCAALASPQGSFDLRNHVREAVIVPETMKADVLLAELRRRRSRHAVVIDEYGGTAGVVTFEGLMERIVGEPGPAPGQRISILPDGTAIIDGLALVSDLNEQFGLHIDERTYNTIGGYVLGRLGRRARTGDSFDVEGRLLQVESLDGLRVASVRLSPPRQEPERERDEDWARGH
ncbi:MAG: hemolysin family protein [Vicinamibacterales bacterium]